MVLRFVVASFWVFSVLAAMVSVVYLGGFVGNRYTPSTVDSGLQIPEWEAAVVDAGLLLLFAAQHSLLARGFAKRGVAPVVQRSLYLLTTALVLGYLFWRWEPIPNLVWEVRAGWARAVIGAVSLAGAGLVAWSIAVIGAGDLLGTGMMRAYWRGVPFRDQPFAEPGPYRWSRHPMMLGAIVWLWAAAEMSWGHMLFSGAMTLYVLIAVWFEERDLARRFGEQYRDYQRRVPMLVPGL